MNGLSADPTRAMSAFTIVCSAWPWWLVANLQEFQLSVDESFKGLGKVLISDALSTKTVVRNAAEPGHKRLDARKSESNSAS